MEGILTWPSWNRPSPFLGTSTSSLIGSWPPSRIWFFCMNPSSSFPDHVPGIHQICLSWRTPKFLSSRHEHFHQWIPRVWILASKDFILAEVSDFCLMASAIAWSLIWSMACLASKNLPSANSSFLKTAWISTCGLEISILGRGVVSSLESESVNKLSDPIPELWRMRFQTSTTVSRPMSLPPVSSAHLLAKFTASTSLNAFPFVARNFSLATVFSRTKSWVDQKNISIQHQNSPCPSQHHINTNPPHAWEHRVCFHSFTLPVN